MESKGKQYKWKILAWNALRNSDSKKWTLQESQWFDNKEDYIIFFKEKTRASYDIGDSAEDLKNTYWNVELCPKNTVVCNKAL